MTDAADVSGVKHIQTIDRLEWDYRRRLGNVILKIGFIRRNTYRYDKTKKHKTNDKKLKRKISISNRIIRNGLTSMFGSIMQWFSPEIKSYSNRLKEIEEEMKADHEREQLQQRSL